MKKAFFSKFFLLFACIAADFISKLYVLRFVPPLEKGAFPFGGFALLEWSGLTFSLNTVVNTGIACGLLPGWPTLLLALRLIIIAALFFWLFRRPTQSVLPLWLIAAGAIGNVVDMIQYGYVIDFLHFRFFGWSFPIFNLADSLITIGAILLFFWPKPHPAPSLGK